MPATYVVGDVRDLLSRLPDGSIDLVLTSPPFLGLRSYLPAGHPLKHLEIGTEADPAVYLEVLLGLTAEFGRVLAPHGSICVELGDTYVSPGGTTDNRETTDGGNDLVPRTRLTPGPGRPLTKSLAGIPHLYHLSLAYGRNLLTGTESPAGQWRIRNVISWARPNPVVGALGDKFRPATSFLTVACRGDRRYFDLEAVRRPAPRLDNKRGSSSQYQAPGQPARGTRVVDEGRVNANPGGAPPLDWWEPTDLEQALWDEWADQYPDERWVIPSQPYPGAHFAVYPPALVERPLRSMVPPRVCLECGEPSTRIVETERVPRTGARSDRRNAAGVRHDGEFWQSQDVDVRSTTVGWTDCGHGSSRPGRVLDPFAGSGTTLSVATGLGFDAIGFDAIGFDLDVRNADLALDRVGPLLLEVVDHTWRLTS